jgi:hypothetical protein
MNYQMVVFILHNSAQRKRYYAWGGTPCIIPSQRVENDNHGQSQRNKPFNKIILPQKFIASISGQWKNIYRRAWTTTATSTCSTFSAIRFNVSSLHGMFPRQSHLAYPTKSGFTDTSTLAHDDYIKSLRKHTHPLASGEIDF